MEPRPPFHVGSGDQPALVELYQRWAPLVYGLALSRTGSSIVAAEVTYEVFLAVWQGPDEVLATDGAMRARLTALTRGRCARLVQRPANVAPVAAEATDGQCLARSLAMAASAPELSAVPHPQQRLALALTYFAGFTLGDAARILGLSRATVVGQISAGLRLR